MKLNWKKYHYLEIEELDALYFDGSTEEGAKIAQELRMLHRLDTVTGETILWGVNINDSKPTEFIRGYIILYLNNLFVCYLHDFELNAKEINMNKKTEEVIFEKELEKLENLSIKEQESFRYNDNQILAIWITILSLSVIWTSLLCYIAYKVFMYLV